jgi:hypothetical protein
MRAPPAILLLTVMATLLAPMGLAATLTVPGSSPTIQGAIGMALSGDTILVAPGTYTEHLTLISGITLIGADAATTIIDGGGVGTDVVQAISVTNVTIQGFTITGAISGGGLPGGAGVFVNHPHATVVLQELIITGNDFGVGIFNSWSVTGPDIIDCEIHGNFYHGISGPGNGLITGCRIHGNLRHGISQSGNSSHPQIIGNTIWGNVQDGFNYWNDFAPTLRNNIFAANGGYGIQERAPGTFVDPIVEYNLFFGNVIGNYFDVQTGQVCDTAVAINGLPNASNNLVDDPLFCGPTADFHLQPGSPAAGAGLGGVDIGALGVGCTPVVGCSITAPSGSTEEGNVLVDYLAVSPTSTPADITPEWSSDAGVSWNPATGGPGGDGTLGLATDPVGVPHAFDWDSRADIPMAAGAVGIDFQITIDDGSAVDTCATTFTVDNSCPLTLCGDCNQDGQVTILDALGAAQSSAGIITLGPVQFSNCNVTGLLEPDPSATVDILDALTIAQVAAGLGVSLTCC